MMATPPTRWQCLLLPLLLLLLKSLGVDGQATLGSADSFLPEHLDVSAATTTGKTLEVTPLSDASVTNAAVSAAADATTAEAASDPSSPGSSQSDDSLIFTATDSLPEDTTPPDFDDYYVDDTETTLRSIDPPENSSTLSGQAGPPEGEQGTEDATAASPHVTGRIVFPGPVATASTSLPPVQSTRHSSVVRELDDTTTDLWRPNWPSQLLESTEEPTQRPSIRFPTSAPTATTEASLTTPTPSYTATKVPVTQYYFDLASVSPTTIPGPLFDRQDVDVSPSSSVYPDLTTQSLEQEDLSSTISDLQSSVLVHVAGSRVTSTPALPHSTTPPVIANEASLSISQLATTQTVSPTSTVLNDVVEGHLDNTLLQEGQAGSDTILNTEPSEIISPGTSTQSNFGLDQSDNTTTSEEPSSLSFPVVTSEAPQRTSSLKPSTQSPAVSTPPLDSEPLTTTSSTTPGSVKPSSVRTSQAAKSTRTPLWQLLSQSTSSRAVNTPSSSNPLTPSVAITLAADSVTPITSAPPPLQSTSVEPPLDESSVPSLTSFPSYNESNPESTLPVDSDPSTPLDIDDPDDVLTNTKMNETESATLDFTESPTSTPKPTEASIVDTPVVSTDEEVVQNITIQDSTIDTHQPTSTESHTSVDNATPVDVVDNALDGTQPNILTGNNTTENITQHGNGIFDDPKVNKNESLLNPDNPNMEDSVVDPTEVPVTSSSPVSVTWTPIVDVTESTPTLTSTTSSTSPVPSVTTVVSQTPPELLTGFTPIISSTLASHSEEVGESSPSSPSSASTADSISTTTTTASAPAQDLSTQPAPSRTLTASLAPTAVQKTDSESSGDDSSVSESIYPTVRKTDPISPSSDLLPSTLVALENEETSVAPQTPPFLETFQTSPSPESVFPESTVVESLLEPTTLPPERLPPSSTTVTAPEILPSSSDTPVSIHTSHTNTDLSSVLPPSSSLPQPSASPVFTEMSVTSSPLIPDDAPKSLASVFHHIVPESTVSSTLSDVSLSSPVPVFTEVPASSIIPDVPEFSRVPFIPEVSVSSMSVPLDVHVTSAVPALSDVPASSTAPVLTDLQEPTESSTFPVPTEVSISSAVPMLPDNPVSSASIAILPTSSLRPTSDSPTLVVPTATDDSIPTPLPQPAQPDVSGDEGTHQDLPEKETEPEYETEPPPPSAKPLPSPALPDTSTSTTTSSTTSSTITTTTTTTTETVPDTPPPTTQPTTAASNTTTPSAMPKMNQTTAAPGTMPTLTTTTVLDNGTAVVVELPYIRALVDYNVWEFCQRKHDFRAMFAEWITRYLNNSVQVVLTDITFFAMAECPSSPPSRDDLSHEDASSLDATAHNHNHTHVYFYVTSAGEVDPELTEKFPLFPTDLVIREDLMYLVPRVMQLEVVRPDESTSQDQLHVNAVGTSVIVIIVICSIVGVTIIVALFFFMVVKRRGASNNYYGRRCTPVSMDAYSMDSVSVYHSFRRKSKRRASGRSMKSYLNQAFDDPNGPSRPLNFAKLTHFISDIDGVHEEFATIPVNMPKYDELPAGVEDKNRYANVIPVPETRVLLKVTKDGRNCEYINANFVRGARNESKYYIATQAPLDDTVADFWRMIWEQETRVVVMLTDFVEKGIDKCADYLPPSETLDCHRLYGDFQVTLKSRDMREKFVVSNVQLKNLENNLVREVAHMWFTGWPASGVPNEEGAFISFILEVRRTRKKLRAKGPIVVHCSPGTGRSGTFLASDIVMKQFEEHRTIDVARTVYTIRRDRAGAVQTKEQYAFIYRVINLYASKLTSGNLESL